MVVPLGHGREIQILITAADTLWIQALETHLTNIGYHYTIARSQSEAQKLLEADSIQVILGNCSTETISLMQSMRSSNPDLLLILVVPDETAARIDEQVLSLVDLIIELNSPYLELQIANVLKLHLDNQHLQKKAAKLGKKMEEQIRLTNQIELLKNAIVRNVSHELRTPLLQMKSAVSLLKEEVSSKTLIEYAENAMARLEVIVRNITMLGHSLDIKLGPIILRDAIEFSRRQVSRVWQRKADAERITVEIEPNLPPINADKQGLSTVLQLLIDNALKFGENKPIKVIGRKQDDGTIYIAVKDDGIGIADDKRQTIFDSFYQIDNSSTRRYGGAGVGLAIVKLILDAHHTEIHVESKEGKGSTFWFTLPYIELPPSDIGKDDTDNTDNAAKNDT